jgi:hypothetical protein
MPYKDPEKRRAVVRESVRRSRAGESKPARKPLPELEALRLKTAKDVIGALEEQLNIVRGSQEVGVAERARIVGYLGSILLRAFEQADLTDRLEVLEGRMEGTRPEKEVA